jgi:monoamine oxidase
VERFGLGTFEQHLDGDTMYEDLSGTRRLAGNLVDAPARRFADGAAQLADRLAGVLPDGCVRYGCGVDAVEHGSDRELVVVTGPRRWSCRHVVLAVPPPLAAAIRLPDDTPAELLRVAASTPVWMGQIAKVVAVYPEPFWRADGLAGAGISRVGPMQETHDMSGPNGHSAALFGFAPAILLGTEPEAPIIQQLGRLFGPSATEPERLLIQNWNIDPHTVPQQAARQRAMARADSSLYGHGVYQRPTLRGRLHWSSTETAIRHPGHIEGAIEAAERVATTILQNPDPT